MAVFKVVKDEKHNAKLYETETDLYNLISYVYKKSYCNFVNRLVDMGPEVITNQMLALQKCAGDRIHHRAIHYVLSYDTAGCEWEMSKDMVQYSIYDLVFCMDQYRLNEYQYYIGMHENINTRHLHIIISPVNVMTGKILHYSYNDYQKFLKDLAQILFNKYRIALKTISYVNENGKLKFDGRGSYLYENINFPWDPHLKTA